jgi:hypothetical protein
VERQQLITISPAGHPDPRVAHAGFDLEHAYIERCWAPVLGPPSTALLRRLPALWAEAEPARMDFGELSRSLGVGTGRGAHSPLSRTMDRLARYRFARPAAADGQWEVFRQVRPLEAHELRRLPEWSRRMHTELLDRHIAGLTRTTPTAQLTARLDRIQTRRPPDHRPITTPSRHIEP